MNIDFTSYTDKLIFYFDQSPIIHSFVTAFLDEITDLDTLTNSLYTERTIDSAVGVQLDQIGYLVGEYRQGRSDEDFRLGIKLRIAINNSSGTVEDIISVLQLLFSSETEIIVNRVASARLSVYVGVEAPTLDIRSFLQNIISAGVALEDITYSQDNPLIFTEREGINQETGILPERGDVSPDVRIAPERA